MSRPWPRSLMGQMLLAVAIALLIVQGLSAFLVYRAQSEMREAGMVHAIAFKLLSDANDESAFRSQFAARHGYRHGIPRMPVEVVRQWRLQAGELRDAEAEARLAQLLENQGAEPQAIVITERRAGDDAFAVNFARSQPDPHDAGTFAADRTLIVAAVRLAGSEDWRVARVRGPRAISEFVQPLITQTLLIYLVLVGALALILRRITRPLADLTDRTEQFAKTRDADSQIEPRGPTDVRRLIAAHNEMVARIAALLDEKDMMLGAIGHDLKTPLAALRVRLESVDDQTLRMRMAASIEDITRSLDDILSLARVGRPNDPPERSELSALIASIVDEYEDMGEPVALGDTQRIVLELRPTWLRRALRNLIDNAVRYGGGALVSLRQDAGAAVISIEDDGPGIPEDAIDEMMNPFMRGDPSRNRGTGGAGLGLTLARSIAEQHGGRLQITNRRDPDGSISGLTAELFLPLG